MSIEQSDTICALATVSGQGAIAVIRVSGEKALEITSSIFQPANNSLSFDATPSHKLRYGSIIKDSSILDEVLVSIFRSPGSYTGEDMTEISCHGSQYIQQEIIKLLLSKGARMAEPGEFSKRAFLNGKMDLSQAEAVADLISSENEASHRIAIQQMKGGFSRELSEMRKSLLEIVSLMELELDFSEEDVEFADRNHLKVLLYDVIKHISSLIDSFSLGNVIKNGVPVAIAGATNTGKSTLLNMIINEERAIVSDIHGTTRDYIEGFMNLDGTGFRFIDTAGLRNTKEEIEMIGIERSFEKIKAASIVLLMLDATRSENFKAGVLQLSSVVDKDSQHVILLLNKCDMVPLPELMMQMSKIKELCTNQGLNPVDYISISAKSGEGVDLLKNSLLSCCEASLKGSYPVLVSNMRHYEALVDSLEALQRVDSGIDSNIPTDLMAQDIREALFYIGKIVGEINTEEILGNIFSKFCIGK